METWTEVFQNVGQSAHKIDISNLQNEINAFTLGQCSYLSMYFLVSVSTYYRIIEKVLGHVVSFD